MSMLKLGGTPIANFDFTSPQLIGDGLQAQVDDSQ
jgi:hypothetical protein